MESIIHADIFFFISTVVLITIGVLGGVALVYVILILHDAKHISTEVRKETNNIATLVRELCAEIRTTGFKMSSILRFIRAIFSSRRFVKSKHSKGNGTEEK
ncbi:MAG TPA: hypothetical protein VI981_02450 [Candidatus Paceibacterota bacterium]